MKGVKIDIQEPVKKFELKDIELDDVILGKEVVFSFR